MDGNAPRDGTHKPDRVGVGDGDGEGGLVHSRRRDVGAAVKAGAVQWLTRRREGGLGDGVSGGPEVEFDRVSHRRREGAGFEDEAILAGVDGVGGAMDLERKGRKSHEGESGRREVHREGERKAGWERLVARIERRE